MIIEHFIAAILVCALNDGRCDLYQDVKGPVDTREECQINMDALWQRIIVSEQVVELTGEFSKVQFAHRGFCFNSVEDNRDMQIKKWYDQ